VLEQLLPLCLLMLANPLKYHVLGLLVLLKLCLHLLPDLEGSLCLSC
jgi:hypothetical protein